MGAKRPVRHDVPEPGQLYEWDGGWHDPDPWTYLVLELTERDGAPMVKLLCLGSGDERRVGEVIAYRTDMIEEDIAQPSVEVALWSVL